MTDSEETLVDACSEAVRDLVVTNRWLVCLNVLTTSLLFLTLFIRK